MSTEWAGAEIRRQRTEVRFPTEGFRVRGVKLTFAFRLAETAHTKFVHPPFQILILIGVSAFGTRIASLRRRHRIPSVPSNSSCLHSSSLHYSSALAAYHHLPL